MSARFRCWWDRENDVSAQLNVTGSSTTVEVTASGETAAVNTETQTLSQVITAQQIADLPTLTRNPYDLVATAGNVAEDTNSMRGAGFAINGQRSSDTDILLDGGENVDLFTATVGQSVPLDSVRNSALSPRTSLLSTDAPAVASSTFPQSREPTNSMVRCMSSTASRRWLRILIKTMPMALPSRDSRATSSDMQSADRW